MIQLLKASINWGRANSHVLKLQRKIAVAYVNGDMNSVRKWQNILVASAAGRILAVWRVITAKGGNTPGLDGFLVNSVEDFWNLVARLKMIVSNPLTYRAFPVKRVMIPKPGSTKERPIGIPNIFDRCVQALYLLALTPIAEAQADSNSFGFRAGLSTLDAVFTLNSALVTLPRPKMVLDADIKDFFGTISHQWLIDNIPLDPRILVPFLTAGYSLDGKVFDTPMGFPQGAVISPALANMTLDGLQKLVLGALKKYPLLAKTVHFVRYADDFVITGPSGQYISNLILPLITSFLAERGLSLSLEKTKIQASMESLSFLGYQFQWLPNRFRPGKFWLRLSPSEKAIKLFKASVDKIFTDNWNSGLQLIVSLNYFLQGWSNYHKFGHASITFTKLDKYVWDQYVLWAKDKYRGASLTHVMGTAFVKAKGTNLLVPYARDEAGKAIELFRMQSVKIRTYGPIRKPKNTYLE